MNPTKFHLEDIPTTIANQSLSSASFKRAITQGSHKKLRTKFHDFSMTNFAIFHDHLQSRFSQFFIKEIHYWTILETMITATIFKHKFELNLWFSTTISTLGILGNFSREIHYRTILKTTISVTILQIRIRV